jgi:hypothetical protein
MREGDALPFFQVENGRSLGAGYVLRRRSGLCESGRHDAGEGYRGEKRRARMMSGIRVKLDPSALHDVEFRETMILVTILL